MKTNRLLCSLLALVFIISAFAIPAMANDKIIISVGGQKIIWENSAEPFVENNDIMLPLRKVVNALGGSYQEVEAQGQQRKVAVLNSKILLVIVGSKEYAVTELLEADGGFTYSEPKTYFLDNVAAEKNGDVFFPLKHFCAATGIFIKQTGNTVDFIINDEESDTTKNDEGIKVLLNGTKLIFDVPPQLISGRTMVPMRKIFESMGAEVQWDNDTQTVTATKDDIVIIMQIDNVVMNVRGKEITLDVPPQLIGGRTLVPVRAVAEGLNAQVQWDGDTQTVIITKEESFVMPSSALTKPARYPEDGVMFGYGNDGIDELQYNARYIFEQSELPSYIFEYEKETIEYINASNASKIKEIILSIWELAAAQVIFNDAELSGEMPDIKDEDEFWALVDKRRPIFGMGDEHIVDVAIEKIDDNTNAVIVKMLDTNWTLLSTYIGIAYNKTAGLKIFTLERSIDMSGGANVPYMFCYIEDGSRGSYEMISNDNQAFINAIKGVMSSS